MTPRGIESGGTMVECTRHAEASSESAEDLLAAIYDALGESLQVEPDDEPIPVADTINPEALVNLFNDDAGETYVSFPVSDRRVTVHSDGEVIVHRSER